MMCRRWRPVPAHLYGRTRLVCHQPRDGIDHGPVHKTRDGWMWEQHQHTVMRSSVTGSAAVEVFATPPTRLWYCHGDVSRCTAKLLASYDQARTSGWRIHLDHGRIDAMCPDCARPDPAVVALCRDLEKSVRR